MTIPDPPGEWLYEVLILRDGDTLCYWQRRLPTDGWTMIETRSISEVTFKDDGKPI